MNNSREGIQRRQDSNGISLQRYQQKRKQKFNKNSNIIGKYRHHKEKLYEEAGIKEGGEAGLDNHQEDEFPLNTKDNRKSSSYREIRNRNKMSHKPDPFFHSKLKADEHRQEVEVHLQQKEQKQQGLEKQLLSRKKTAHKMQQKTQRGQPLMKFQIPNLLEKITSRMKQKK